MAPVAQHARRMRNVPTALAVLTVALALAGGARAAPCALSDLGWIAGVWRDDTADTKSEERWVVAPDDRLMGSAWELHPGRPGGVVESETIQAVAGAVVLRLRHSTADLGAAWEDKTAPMTFALAGCGANQAVFDGQADHAGEHITYRRAGDTLTFTGDFLHQGKPAQVVITFEKER
jgi:uncharacterized protein DUF6265